MHISWLLLHICYASLNSCLYIYIYIYIHVCMRQVSTEICTLSTVVQHWLRCPSPPPGQPASVCAADRNGRHRCDAVLTTAPSRRWQPSAPASGTYCKKMERQSDYYANNTFNLHLYANISWSDTNDTI